MVYLEKPEGQMLVGKVAEVIPGSLPSQLAGGQKNATPGRIRIIIDLTITGVHPATGRASVLLKLVDPVAALNAERVLEGVNKEPPLKPS
jgi:hypothetical protein